MVEQSCDDLRALAHGMAIIGECSPRSLDTFASYGELLSTTALAAGFAERMPEVLYVDVRNFMITDDVFTKAKPDIEEIERRVATELVPLFHAHRIVITQGFIGATLAGATTTIGRGGSDYSAALLGVAAGATEIEIWTDVNGVLTADPRIIPHAKNIAALTFNEASELAYFGAKAASRYNQTRHRKKYPRPRAQLARAGASRHAHPPRNCRAAERRRQIDRLQKEYHAYEHLVHPDVPRA